MEFRQFTRDIAPLAWGFSTNPEKCHNPDHYDEYIKHYALADYSQGYSVTYVFLDVDSAGNAIAIAGYVSVRASSLIMANDGKHRGRSALEIIELAVDKRYSGKGIGLALMAKVLTEIAASVAKVVGLEYVVVCADHTAVDFYKHNSLGFQELTSIHEVPRNGWNDVCVPMCLRITPQTIKTISGRAKRYARKKNRPLQP